MITPLYARYNGAMLGFFLSGALARYAKPRYPILRDRMNQFLEEMGLPPILSPEQPSYSAQGRIIEEVIFMVRMESEIVADFAYMACTAFQSVILRNVDNETAEQCGRLALEWMAKYKIAPAALNEFSTAVVPSDDGSISADDLHSAGLGFLKALIDPLKSNNKTAFVAMPFAPPFDGYFPKFYSPLLAELKYCAVRAWGGLAHENYQEIVGALIRKSGVVLADLTSQNINVIHEVGLAEGMGKPVFLIVSSDEIVTPSNLGDLAIVRYDRSRRRWEDRAIRECAAILALGKLGLELKAKRP